MNDLQRKNVPITQQNVDPKKAKLYGKIMLYGIILLDVFLIYKFVVPEFVNITVQKGYKAVYEEIENKYREEFADDETFQINNICCYKTKRLSTIRILESAAEHTEDYKNEIPDITHIYKINFQSEKTLGLQLKVYCGYNSKTGEVVYFGADSKYYDLENKSATKGEYGNYRKVINSKFLSDVIELLY